MPRTELVRVYLPLTSALLRRAREEGAFGPAPLLAHTVTPAVRVELGEDQEECEYAVMVAASAESLSMLGPDDEPRRVVAAVDVARWEARGAADVPVSAVLLPDAVPWRRLAAVLVDSDDAVPDVVAVREGGGDAEIERCLDHDLGWFATQEVGQLLDPGTP